MVRIENRNERGVQPLQSAVDIAGLGMGIVVTRHVADTRLFTERAELFALAVIEDVDVQLFGGPINVHRRQRGVAHNT